MFGIFLIPIAVIYCATKDFKHYSKPIPPQPKYLTFDEEMVEARKRIDEEKKNGAYRRW